MFGNNSGLNKGKEGTSNHKAPMTKQEVLISTKMLSDKYINRVFDESGEYKINEGMFR